MNTLLEFVRETLAPHRHPMADEVQQGTDRVVEQSERLAESVERHRDAFADMVKGFKGESRSRPKRR